MSLYIDLTEFLCSLRKTGIERIAGEMCRYLPLNAAIPVRFHSDCYVALPPKLIEVIGSYFGNATESASWEIKRLGEPENGHAVQISDDDIVLVPELLTLQRAEYFRRMSDGELRRYRFIVPDLLPATHPEYFLPEIPLILSGYFQIVRRANCGFISEDTQEAYYQRLKRTDARGGVVLSLGCDSLGPRGRRPTLDRPLTFTVLGTIEPRKNHDLILEAFEPLFGKVEGLMLSFIGKIGWVDPEFVQKVQALASDKTSGFSFHPTPGDDEIRNYVEQSRATIYVSAAEGYGLPPVESLWLGTPVIASKMVPSLKNLGQDGINYVEPLTVVNLRQAVLAFMDNAYANQKIEETTRLNLPTWRSFTEEVLSWCAK